ncbi:MAG: glutathione S-transferase family protein, partial [Pseudomonadota bacterium]
MPEIKLFHFTPTRSKRVVWALEEAGLAYDMEGPGQEVFDHPELESAHPLKKLPAALVDGKPLFESAALVTYFGDLVPEKGLVAKPYTFERAQHDQWCHFNMTEMEAWLWASAINTFVLPEEERLDVVHEQNKQLFRRGAAAMDQHLESSDYLVGNTFSMADVLTGFTVNWGRGQGWLDGFQNLHGYLD